MKYTKENGLYIPDYSDRNLCSFTPGIMPIISAQGPPLANLQVWWDLASQTGYADTETITTLTDFSGNGNTSSNGTGGLAYRTTTVTVNGLPVAYFNGVGNIINTVTPFFGGLDTSAWTAATLAVVGRATVDPGASASTSGQWQTVYPNDYTVAIFSTLTWHADGVIYDANFTTATKTTGDPTDSLASPFLYLLTSTDGAWTLRINGVQHYTTATNTFIGNSEATYPSLRIGYSERNGANSEFRGVVGEVLLYDAVVSGGDLTQLETYLMSKWAI